MPHAAALPLTGERTVPGVAAENYWFRRHEAAYRYAAPMLAGRRVLEVGSGEGYGTAALAAVAAAVLGVDYDRGAVRHAAATYRSASFVRGNLAALPVRSGSVDAVVALQVIEHVWDCRQFLREARRVLRPGGTFLVSTPNRLTFSPGRDTPLNPFHTTEFTAAELTALLVDGGFAVAEVAGLHAGCRLAELDRSYPGSFVAAQLAAPAQSWPPRLRAHVAAVRADDFDVLPAAQRAVDTALDLVVVGRRR